MKLPVCTVLLTAVNMLTPFALAQDGKPAADSAGDLGGMNLEQLMNVQFYTASRHAQEASDTPASATIITREDIHDHGYRTLADALQSVRGFWLNSDRNYSYVGVRGFARPGDYNSRVLLLVNGHRLNENVYDSALIGTEFPLDMNIVERIEIVRGPGSSLYGTSAMFGVINVITRKPFIAPALEITVEAATLDTVKARITAGSPNVLNGALVSGSMYDSEGNHRLYFPEFDSPDTNNGIAQGVDGDSYVSGFASLGWNHFELQGLIGSRTKVIPTASFGTVFNDPANRTTDARGFIEISYKRDFISGIGFLSDVSYDGYLYHGTYALVYDGDRVLEHDEGRGEWVSNNTQVTVPFGIRNTLIVGTEIRDNLRQLQALDFLDAPIPSIYTNRSSHIFAVYAQDEMGLTHRLRVNAGLRFDHYSTFGSTVNPRIAAIFHAGTTMVIKYSVGRAFRAPNVYEMFYSDGTSQEANPGLRPERIQSQQLSVERAFTPTFHVIAEAFYNSLSELVNAQIDPATGFYQYANLNSSNARGLEAEIDAQRRWVSGQLSYTVQRSIDGATSAALSNSPQHLVKMNARMHIPPGLLAALDARYESPQSSFTGAKIPDSMTVNVNMSNRKPILGFDFVASCYDLMDRSNYAPPSPAMTEKRLLMDSRGFRFEITRRMSKKR